MNLYVEEKERKRVSGREGNVTYCRRSPSVRVRSTATSPICS